MDGSFRRNDRFTPQPPEKKPYLIIAAKRRTSSLNSGFPAKSGMTATIPQTFNYVWGIVAETAKDIRTQHGAIIHTH